MRVRLIMFKVFRTLNPNLFQNSLHSMARQSKLNFASKTSESEKSTKTTKRKQTAKKTQKLTKALKEELSKDKSDVIATTSNNAKPVDSSLHDPPYEWCRTYPGSVSSLSKYPVEADSSWDMKLVSWNINGLRAWIKNGGLSYLQTEVPDILCLQEIKCAKKDVPPAAEAVDYQPHWYSANKPGYAGTGFYSKSKPLKVTYGLGIAKHDTEGRLITIEFERFYLLNSYVPNSGQGLVRLGYRTKEWNKDLCEYIKKLDKKKPVILTGDLNVSHQEIDLANPDGNHRSAGFTDEERQGFSEMLKDCNLVDTYRHFYPKREKAYTYWSTRHNARKSNAGWRLDYFVVSKRMLANVVDQEIRCGVLGSDHCPIVLYLKF